MNNSQESIDPADESAPPVVETVEDIKAEGLLLERAIGGWRGLIDSGLPTVVFITVFAFDQTDLSRAVIAAVVVGAVIALWRVIRREPLKQVLTGFIGLLIAAGFSAWTGEASDFFLPGLLTNLAYGSAFLISILIRWPLLGIAMGYMTGEGTTWRKDPVLRRAYGAASWIWVGLFLGRLAVQLPLYLAGSVGALGVVKIVMGWPLFLAAAWFTYRLLSPILAAKRGQVPPERDS
jgi:hypothetical protein